MKYDENTENTKCGTQQSTENAVKNAQKCRRSNAEVPSNERHL